MNHKRLISLILATVAAGALVAGCASRAPEPDIDALVAKMMAGSFRDQGIARADRLQQDESNAACSKAETAASRSTGGGTSCWRRQPCWFLG